MSKTKKILTAVTLVWLCILLVMFTYTWVLRNWTPSVTMDNQRISPAGSLVITLTDDGWEEVDLNMVTALESFVFQQVSSIDGQNFLKLDFTPTLDDNPAVYQYLDAEAVKQRIVEVEFAVKLDDAIDTPKYVFLHPDCFIKDSNEEIDVAGAIRIALQYDTVNSSGVPEQKVTILGNTSAADGIDLSTNAVRKDSHGKTEGADGALGQQRMYSFNYFHGGRGDAPINEEDPSDPANYDFTVDPGRCLFSINPGETKWVTMRVWLEGTDENCVDKIAGQTFDMKLKFDSVSVPTVTE